MYIAVELEVGSSRNVGSLKVLLDIAQPGKLDDSDHCSKPINKMIATNDYSPQ